MATIIMDFQTFLVCIRDALFELDEVTKARDNNYERGDVSQRLVSELVHILKSIEPLNLTSLLKMHIMMLREQEILYISRKLLSMTKMG